MSLPSASAKGERACSYCCDDKISLNLTTSRFIFGSSNPITDLPGIISTTRTLITDNDRAKSLAKLVMRLALVPAASCNSNLVTTGPG
ncbi:MAG: hypothetical protein ACD_21C00170G0001 [uncultured bacterium]|nr:MAG: hypothetical protein ACD_21C00170G0001 [uncultured bacterium]